MNARLNVVDGSVLGRSDIIGNFHDNEYERLSLEKSEERRRVADFILSHFDGNEWLYLLSMPGTHWLFEHLVNRLYPRMQVVGLERSATIFLRSIPSMLNCSTAMAIRTMPFGSGNYEYARAPAAPNHPNPSAQSHRLLCMASSTYTTAASIEASNNQHRKFEKKFYSRKAAWLDFTSGFCEVVDTTVANLHHVMFRKNGPAPVVLTFMYGRDITGKEIGRINHIHKLNPRFEAIDYWTYLGKSGTPMMTVCGRFDAGRQA